MPRPIHRDEARKVLVGIVVLALMGVVAYIGITVQAGNELPGKSYTYVKAEFENVGTLKPLQDVSQYGVRIGQVSSVIYENGHAVVTMRLDGERAVYRDATARLGNESALGRKQVHLDPGTKRAGPLGNRVLPMSQTNDSAAVEDVLAAFDGRTRTGLRNSVRELGGLAGHSKDLHDVVGASPEMLDDLGTVSGALASREADLPALLASANRLAYRFHGRQQELSNLIERMDATFRAINVDGARPLDETVDALPATLRQAQAGLKSLNGPLANVRSAMTTVQPGAQALGTATGDVRGLLREAVDPLEKVPGVSDKAIPAVEDLTHTFADLRPLVSRASMTLAEANQLLQGLAPYATDIGRLFSEHDLLSGKISPTKHYFSAQLVFPGLYNASVPDPTVQSVPYPEPGGGAYRDEQGGGGN